MKNILKNQKVILTFIIILFFALIFVIVDAKKTKAEQSEENQILEILEENKKFGEEWRQKQELIEQKQRAIEILIDEKNKIIKEKEQIEEKIQKNRLEIDRKIKKIENPDYIEQKSLEVAEIEVEIVEQKNIDNFWVDIDKLAYAVAMAETWNCTKWIWPKYNNCFWIKNWSIAPCKKRTTSGNIGMCIYNTQAESYEAFKKIWLQWYGDRFPTYQDAVRWTGNDKPDNWLYIVKTYYYN